MVKKQEVIIFGTGDIAQLAHFYITHDSPHQVVAFCADAEFIHSNEFLGLPLAPFEEIVDLYPPNDFDMLVALSYSQLNEVRARKYNEAKESGAVEDAKEAAAKLQEKAAKYWDSVTTEDE